jgi:ribonuclease PH
VALALAIRKLVDARTLSKLPALTPVAAVSVGIVKGQVVTDLDYEEDSTAEVDLNVVANAQGNLIEVQGTAENGAFTKAQLDQMMDAGLNAIAQLTALQQKALG